MNKSLNEKLIYYSKNKYKPNIFELFTRILNIFINLFFCLFLKNYYKDKWYLYNIWKKIETILSFPWMKKELYKWRWKKILLDWNNYWVLFRSENKSENTSKHIIYFFHWNWETLNNLLFQIYIYNLNSLWFDVFAIEYVWFWESNWFPYEEELTKLWMKWYSYLVNNLKFQKEKIIFLWYSIWTWIVLNLIKNFDKWKIILFAPFTSRYDMTKSFLWFILQRLFWLENTFISIDNIKNVNIPLLIFHWEKDKVIPISMWKLIFEKCWTKNKKIIEIQWWRHDNLLTDNFYKIKDFLLEFVLDSDH